MGGIKVTLYKAEKMTTTTTTTYHYSAVSEETALNIEGWPYGRKLKTTKSFWIETTKHGQRLCMRTINPKTGNPNAIKKTTYSPILIVRESIDSEGNKDTGSTGISNYSEVERLEAFKVLHGENLTEYQVKQIDQMIAIKGVLSRHFEEVEEKIVERDAAPRMTEEEMREYKIRSESELRKCNMSFPVYMISVHLTGIKKRCRKTDREYFTLGYTPRVEKFTLAQLDEIREKAQLLIESKMKSYFNVRIDIKKADYNAPTEGSHFSGIQHGLMSSAELTLTLKEEVAAC